MHATRTPTAEELKDKALIHSNDIFSRIAYIDSFASIHSDIRMEAIKLIISHHYPEGTDATDLSDGGAQKPA